MPGRVLSKANEKKLRTATEALAEILALLDKAEDGDSESDSEEVKEARKLLAEAANMGNWLESRIHLSFTQIADDMFGGGRLSREERIALSSAISEALTAFNTFIKSNMPDLYKREPWSYSDDMVSPAGEPDDVEESAPVHEAAIRVDFVPLVEQALRADGTILAKLIQPGWGASGYYPREVLQRDGPKIFLKGLKQFWNHATATEEAERPEGDLTALAAELVSDARWQNGPDGDGLYADAKVFTPYREALNELAPHIGVSIRATGRAQQGEAEGRKGPIITALTAAKSVDFVTEAGAGGKIVEMFEAARQRAKLQPIKEVDVTEQQFKEALAARDEKIAKMSEALITRDARDAIRVALSKTTLPALTQERLLARLSVNLPIKEGALDLPALTERVKAEVEGEVAYLSQVAGYGAGRVEGMGHSQQVEPQTQEALTKQLAESLTRLGVGKEMAASVVGGRW